MHSLGALAPSLGKLLSEPTHSPQDIAFGTTMAARLVGSYPNARAHDPETFTAQLVRLFVKYDRSVVAYVVESLPGQRSKEWDGLPSLATVTEALNARADRLAREFEREQRMAKQFAERDEAARQAERAAATGEKDRIVEGFTKLRTSLRSTPEALQAEAERKAGMHRALTLANERAFVAECEAFGIDPASGISPTLRRKIEERNTDAA